MFTTVTSVTVHDEGNDNDLGALIIIFFCIIIISSSIIIVLDGVYGCYRSIIISSSIDISVHNEGDDDDLGAFIYDDDELMLNVLRCQLTY